MVKIILRGCNGKLGRAITQIAEVEGVEIVAGIMNKTALPNTYPVYSSLSDCHVEADVIIDCSSSHAVSEILDFGKSKKLPIILCTTGLSKEDILLVHETAKEIPILHAPNMSVGITVMIKLLEETAKILYRDFDIEIIEKYHNQKVDTPSGTTHLLADAINEVLGNEYEYKYDRTLENKKREKNEIGISSIRGGTIVGEHEVIFAGLDEVIKINHTAYSRTIFAKGAMKGAKYLVKSKPGLYTMKEIVEHL